MKSFAISMVVILSVFPQESLRAQDELEEVSFSLFHNSCNSVVEFDDYAYLGGEFGLHVIDISNSTSPVFVNCLRGRDFAKIDISEESEHSRLYSVSGNSLWIIDISDRANPVVAGQYQTDHGDIRDFDVEGEFAYLAAESSYYYWNTYIEVIDVSNQTSPTRLSFTPALPRVFGVDAMDAHVYTSFDLDLNPTGMQIFDASNPESIHLFGTLEFNYYTTWEAAPYRNYAYIGSFDGILIVDINDLSHPFYIDPYPLTDFYYLSVFRHYLFAYGASAIYMLDINEPTQPVMVSQYDTEFFCSSLFLSGDILYHSATGNPPRSVSGMNIVDYFDAHNPQFQGRHEIPGRIMDVCKSDNFIYAGTQFTGIFPVDISDPYDPVVGENADIESTISDLFISGPYAYAAAGDAGLMIFDISIPGSPEFIGSYMASDATRSVCVEGNYAYLINARQGLYDLRIVIVDISDPADPCFVNAYDELDDPMHLKVADNIAYISTIYSLEIVDMSDPSSPVHLGGHPYSDYGYDLDVESDLVYVAGWPAGLQIFDISSPSDPTLVGEFDSFAAFDVDVRDGLACLTDYDGVYLLDVSEPSAPLLFSSYDYTVLKNEVIMDGQFVYVASEECILILGITSSGLEEAGIISPNAPSLVQNYPNPFNPATTICYSLPEQSDVRIEIYNILGQTVTTLLDGSQKAGYHSLVWQADDYPSGVYFAQLTANNGTKNIKMLLLK